MRTDQKGDTRIRYFDSPQEYASVARTPQDGGETWNGEPLAQALKHAQGGRLDLVERAERLCEQIAKSVEAYQSIWSPSVAGAFPSVPDYLAGRPDCMRRRIETPTDKSPIRIYVDLWATWSFSAEELINRGISFLALAMILTQERPVEMYAVISGSGDSRHGVDIMALPTNPIDMAVVCSVFYPSFFRCLGIGDMAPYIQAPSHPPLWHLYPSRDPNANETYVARMRALLGASETDVIVGPTRKGDPSTLDPVAFVNKALEDHRRVLDGA